MRRSSLLALVLVLSACSSSAPTSPPFWLPKDFVLPPDQHPPVDPDSLIAR
jgi:hypothetical protein